MDISQKVVSLSKRRGFIYPSSEIYGGFEASYDFGPLGAEMLIQIRRLWWDEFVRKQKNIVGLDGAIISHPRVWDASGHTESFSDVMVEDAVTNKRYRADHLIDNQLDIMSDGCTPEEFDEIIAKNNILSPDGNKLSRAKYFNQLVQVGIGTTSETISTAYLRGETCQPIFYNYDLVKDSMRLKIPFGIAQIGKAFRNEIKVGPFIYRTREFEQMELEMYVSPDDADEYFAKFKNWALEFFMILGIDQEKLRLRDQEFKERAHYNKLATDIEYKFPFGWKEITGIHNRGDWDLRRHGEYSHNDFTYTDEKKEKYVPYIVELSMGLSRLLYVLLMDAYHEDDGRVVLKLIPPIAPFEYAVFPLVKNKNELVKKADSIYNKLIANGFRVAWDDRGNIGKRYYSQDEIGTPKCLTIDYQTLGDNTLTVRDRDSKKQRRVSLDVLLQK